jgi:hypothetical protein
MKTDLYTKIIFTIIASSLNCLTWLKAASHLLWPIAKNMLPYLLMPMAALM